MSVQQREPTSAGSADLEITAELPVLDVAGGDTVGEEASQVSPEGWAPTAPEEERAQSALEHQLRALAEDLADLEQRLRQKDARVVQLEQEIGDLHEERRAAGEGLAAAERTLRELAERDERIRELEAQGRELGRRDRVLADLSRELEQVRAQADRQLEQLQTREMRRGLRELLFDAGDRDSERLHERIAAADAELARRADRIAELERELAESSARAAQVTHELASLGSTLEAERAEHRRAAREHASHLAAQTDANAALEKSLRETAARAQELEADVRAAEDTINRLEADVRGKAQRLEEAGKAGDELRESAEAGRRRIEARDIRIDRLEAGAASTAALIGAIQQSLDRIEPPAEGATRLLMRLGQGSEVVHVLGRRTTVGRTPDNDLQVDARFISRHHAVILAGPVHTVIEDLNSTNGVRVNGRRVTRQNLKDGDIVMIGKTRFRFATRPAPR